MIKLNENIKAVSIPLQPEFREYLDKLSQDTDTPKSRIIMRLAGEEVASSQERTPHDFVQHYQGAMKPWCIKLRESTLADIDKLSARYGVSRSKVIQMLLWNVMQKEQISELNDNPIVKMYRQGNPPGYIASFLNLDEDEVLAKIVEYRKTGGV